MFRREPGFVLVSWKIKRRKTRAQTRTLVSERTRPTSIRKPSLLVKGESSIIARRESRFFHRETIMSGYEFLDRPVIAFLPLPELTCRRFFRLCLFAPRCLEVVRNLRDNFAPFALCAFPSRAGQPGVTAEPADSVIATESCRSIMFNHPSRVCHPAASHYRQIVGY